MLPREAPVLVVGGGPSGLMASLLLEQQGVETVVVERGAGPRRAPAAHVLNPRTFEVCRAAGVDMEAVAAACQAPEDAGYAYFCTKLGGQVFGRHPFERQGDEQLDVTPTPLRNISQNRFEPILVEALARRAGKAPHWGVQWESARQDSGGVLSRVRDLETGEEHEIASRYLLAADGAGSRVRRGLGIEPVGPDRIRSFVMIHFHAKLRGLTDVPPGVLFFLFAPGIGGSAFVIHDLDREAVFMHPFEPETEALEAYDPARCEALVRAGLEDPTLELSIETIGTWTMTAQVAERYGEGRIFLVGDAAHRFPPTGGLGLNSGVQDAHNLAWKIAAVEKGWAPASLLESYEVERKPVAQNNADRSLRNALKLIEVPQALGLLELEGDPHERMEAVLADPAGRARVAEAVAGQSEHFDLMGLHLGFWYERGAVARAASERPPGHGDTREYTPSGCPGARLPHVWLEEGDERTSLLDHVPLDGFLLVAGPEGGGWLDALRDFGGPPIRGLLLRADAVAGLDGWLAQAGIEASGALLVRPDQHVAWRARGSSPDPAQDLWDAMARVLGV